MISKIANGNDSFDLNDLVGERVFNECDKRNAIISEDKESLIDYMQDQFKFRLFEIFGLKQKKKKKMKNKHFFSVGN